VALVAENPGPVPLAGVGGTGLTVAGIRAAETERADRLFADPLAGAFVAAAGSPPSQATGRQAAALRLWVVARTVFLDELVMAACVDGVRQVVLLGAGFDTRAFRLPWPPGVRCFELDTPDVLDSKDRVLAAQHAVPGCERIIVPGDLRDDWPAALRAAGLRPEQPTAWVAEGLLVYLSPDDVDELLDRVTSLSAPGSRLGLTFRRRAPADQTSPAVALRRSAAPDDPVGWLAGHGWAAQLTGAREVLQAHGRTVPAAPAGRQAGHRPRALLISAALDTTLPGSRPARRRSRPASAAPRPHLASPPARAAARATAPPAAPGAAPDRPLPALLAQALVAFTVEFDNESEHQIQHRTTRGPAARSRGPWLVSQAMWANFMRFVPPGGVPLRDVAALAAITNLAGLERWGYVAVQPDPADQRAKPPRRDWVVHPTAAGQRAQHIWRPLTAEIERRWQDRFGADQSAALTGALRAVAGQTGLVLPPYLPVVGVHQSDHGSWLAAGQAASRGAGADLPALLSHVLLAFAMDVERESPLTMVVGAGALRVLSGDPVRVAGLPLRAGLSKEAISVALGLLERRGYAVVEPDPAASRGKVARLTARGQQAQADHQRLVGAVELRWRDRFGAEHIAGLADALRGLFAEADGQQRIAAGLAPYPGGWRAHPPYLGQTEAMLANPAAALPHYPMVSHRGGYPDGS
jgi:methyltransferase (TIGR00027 family)